MQWSEAWGKYPYSKSIQNLQQDILEPRTLCDGRWAPEGSGSPLLVPAHLTALRLALFTTCSFTWKGADSPGTYKFVKDKLIRGYTFSNASNAHLLQEHCLPWRLSFPGSPLPWRLQSHSSGSLCRRDYGQETHCPAAPASL